MSGVDSARLKASPLNTPWTRLKPLDERVCEYPMDDGHVCGPYIPISMNQKRCERHATRVMQMGGPEYRALASKRRTDAK